MVLSLFSGVIYLHLHVHKKSNLKGGMHSITKFFATHREDSSFSILLAEIEIKENT
jgi:hypothetical protein